jgi:isochorismate synthase
MGTYYISDWLFEMQKPVFFIKWPKESYISAFVLEENLPAPNDPVFSWALYSGSNQEFKVQITKTWSLEMPAPVIPRLLPITQQAEAKKLHMARVAKALKAIQAGGAEKLVIARRFDYQIHKFSPTFTYLRLCNKYPEAAVYWYHRPNDWDWMGATPELLTKWNKEKFETMALAGTKGAEELRDWSKKEIQEQQVVTDFITSKLQHIGLNPQVDSVANPFASGPVTHLKTQIFGFLNPDSPFSKSIDLPNALHPTPAVCGIPVVAAKQLISELEDFDRDAYTGFFGFRNPAAHTGTYFVNLRCFRFNDSHLQLYAGGGINSMSDPESEWFETERKLETIRAVL